MLGGEGCRTCGAPAPEPQKIFVFEKRDNPLYAIKTNMLYDAAITPNIGAEVYVAPNMSLSANIYREVAIPVDINWEQGKRYTYTLVFGEGAGYIPPTDTEPGGEVPIGTGDKVLRPIEYTVTVDDYESVDNVDLSTTN